MDAGSSAKAVHEKQIIESGAFLNRTIRILNMIINPTNRVLAAIAATLLTSMMFLTFFDVSLRYSFKLPIEGSMEISEFMMGLVVAFGLGFCALRKGHIRVDFLMTYIPRRVSLILDIISYSAATFYGILISWQAFVYVKSLQANKLVSSALNIPIYPFVFLVMLGIIFLTIVFIKEILESVSEVMKK